MSGGPKKSALTLKQFMLRQETIKLFRSFLNILRDIDDHSQKKEVRDFIIEDFKANKHHTDEVTIKMHHARGKVALKNLQNMISISGNGRKQ